MKKLKAHLEVIDRSPLKWPDGWPRTLINGRQNRSAWKHDQAEPQTSNGTAPNSRIAAVWASWKQKLGGTVAKGIDALLLHGELDSAQLAIAAGLDKRTVTNTVVYKLNQAGLINKNNGRFSLKEL